MRIIAGKAPQIIPRIAIAGIRTIFTGKYGIVGNAEIWSR